MDLLLGLGLLLLAQLAGAPVHLLDVSVPHVVPPAACSALWEWAAGACGPCAAGERALALLVRGVPELCAAP